MTPKWLYKSPENGLWYNESNEYVWGIGNQLQGKSCNVIQTQKGVNWNNYPTDCKRGACCIKKEELVQIPVATAFGDPATVPVMRSKWIIDREIPIFVAEGRQYIEQRITFEEGKNGKV